MEVHMTVTRTLGTIAAIFIAGTSASAQTDTRSSMTVTGCVMQETEYRKTHNLGKGAFFGAGLGNEFVLVEGNCGDTNAGKAYRLTGKSERELKPFVGHRLEVTGTWDHERDAKTAAGQTNAKLPPEIKIASFHEATASAPSASAAPEPSPAPSPAPSQVASNADSNRRLPKTASNLPLIGLIGLLSLSAFFGVRLFGTRSA
jgi:hypothetical protein